jgi:DNA-directed RNA polymerase specialized sigma24 family protein
LLRCQVSTSRSLLCRAREALRHQLTHLRQKGRHS